MKITKKNTDGKVTFGALTCGDIFYYDDNDCFYLRCPQIYDTEENSCYNAIDLATGLFDYFDGDEKVKKIENTELIVEL